MKRRAAVELWTPRASARSDLTLETVLTHPDYFGLVTASPLQRAICRAVEGRPLRELAEHPHVIEAFGGEDAVASLPNCRPAEFVLLAGIRCGKSELCSAAVATATQQCDVSHCSAGDIPRANLVSLKLDTARGTWNHVNGHFSKSEILNGWRTREPTSDTEFVRHPSGRLIEIKLAAGSRAAGNLVARWSAGNVFDEAPRMLGQADGVVNLTEARLATAGRLLEGAQNFMVGSPWAPRGPVYELYQEHFGKPTEKIVVVRAKAYWMNPVYWTPARCEHLRATNPDAYWTDVECNFMDAESGMFTEQEIRLATREKPIVLPFNKRLHYAAGMDPATRGNAWALVVTTNLGKQDGAGGNRYAVVFSHQWQGSASKPLKSREVFTEMRAMLEPYGLKHVTTDQWCIDTLREMAHECGVSLIQYDLTGQKQFELFKKAKDLMADGSLELSPDLKLQSDLCSVRKVVTQQSIRVEFPVGPDGRHADFAPALAKALSRSLLSPAPEELSADEALKAEQARWRKQAQLDVLQRQRQRMRGLA